MKNRKRFLSIGLSTLVMLAAMPTLTVKGEENPVNPPAIKMEELQPAIKVEPAETRAIAR